jgi:methionine-rich copper-binding protein CopC
MTTARSATARRLLAGLVLSLAVLGPTAPAAAHSELESSVPAQGEVVTRPATHVQLIFASEVSDELAHVVVTAPDGTALPSGPQQVAGSTVTTPLLRADRAGSYQVAYRVVADDGHPMTGTVNFTVAAPAAAVEQATDAASVAEPSSTTSPAQPTSLGSGADGRPAAGAWVMGTLAALGVTAVLAARRGNARGASA